MLDGLLVAGPAVAALARLRGTEGAVAGLAGLERSGTYDPRGREQGWRQQRGEAVREQGGRVLQVVGETCGQRSAYGLGGGAALKPGRCGRRQAAHVPLGEQQPGFVAVQLREEAGGGAVALQIGAVRLGKPYLPRWSGPRSGFAVPAGGRRMSGVVAASICRSTRPKSSPVGRCNPSE